jgi:tRNA G18 (ribose-2'-O)-methylase SpoU
VPRDPLPVVSAADPRVADYADIPDPASLAARGLFVAEGRLVVRRLLASRRFRARSLLVNQAALASLRDVLDAAPGEIDVLLAPTDLLAAIAGFNFHRGCLAIGERPRVAPEEVVAAPGASSMVVALEGLSQADNVGSVFRNAAAFGVDGVLLDEACCDPLYRKALRTSMGAVLDLPWSRLAESGLTRLRGAGYRLVALTPAAEATDVGHYARVARHARTALLVGTEGAGLSPAWLAAADDRVRIPMAPGVDSLNVATATGIALYALSAARAPDEAY